MSTEGTFSLDGARFREGPANTVSQVSVYPTSAAASGFFALVARRR